MECPVIATDHESALVQADWYEEHNQQRVANEIREKLTKSTFEAVLNRGQVSTKFSTHTSKYERKFSSKSTAHYSTSRSFCLSGNGTIKNHAAWSVSTSRGHHT